jgi:suppressor of G2 allele of SKP1
MRRAIALFSLGRFGDARLCFTWVRKLNEKEKGLGMWQAKVVQEYDKLDENAAERKTTIKETPDKVERVVPAESHSEAVTSRGTIKTGAAATPSSAPAVAAASALGQTPKEKIRHEWFQSSNKVTITIFAKNVPKDQADIQFTENSVSICAFYFTASIFPANMT